MGRIKEIVEHIGNTIISQKDYLNSLDKAIGDGDHGNNMATGFTTALEDIENLDNTNNVKEILSTIGNAFAENVGGSAGPLYAIAFKQAASKCDDTSEFTLDNLIIAFDASIKGIEKRGRSTYGEKTMLDVLIPVYNNLLESKEKDLSLLQALASASKTAKEASEATRDMQATKGRASYLGIGSIGHLDPGAVSSMLMIREFYNYFQK